MDAQPPPPATPPAAAAAQSSESSRAEPAERSGMAQTNLRATRNSTNAAVHCVSTGYGLNMCLAILFCSNET